MKTNKTSLSCAAIILGLAVFGPGITSIAGVGLLINFSFIALASIPILAALFSKAPSALRLSKPRFSAPYFWGVILIGLQFISMARGITSGDSAITDISYRLFQSAIISLTAIFFFNRFSTNGSSAALQRALLLLSALCVINIAMWIVGVENSQKDVNLATNDQATFLALFGINIKRVAFPLSWGVNTFGTVCAATLTTGLVFLFSQTKKLSSPSKVKASLLILPPLLCCLLTDSRAALIEATACAFLAIYMPRSARPLILTLIVSVSVLIFNLDSLRTVVLPGLTREGGGSVLTGRELIWAPVVAEIMDFKPIHFLGYGQYGHYTSKVSMGYADILAGWGDNSQLIHVHNSYLQSFLDTGYLGVAILFAFLLTCIGAFTNSVRKTNSIQDRMALGLLLFMTIQGFSEIVFQCYQPWIFLLLICLIFQVKATAQPSPSAGHAARKL